MRGRQGILAALAGAVVVVALVVASSTPHRPVRAQGVGDATWTPVRSQTTGQASSFLSAGDAITFRTDAVWDAAQVEGLMGYLDSGLRYTYEVNDRSGRLSATGFWATNHPDPAFDRDDDDGDGRWEEAEVIAGRAPEPGRAYTTLVQLTRWHAKRQAGACRWVWDRRLGEVEVLSQLSRELLGEWQAERFTLTYETASFPRVEPRSPETSGIVAARCQEQRPGDGQQGVVVTFAAPLAWADFTALPDVGSGRWTAFEALGRSDLDELPWTCGGPVDPELGLRPCRDMGVAPDGVVAAIGYLDGTVLDGLRADPRVARIDELQDALTGLLFEVGGFGVEAPGLTINDAYWDVARPGS